MATRDQNNISDNIAPVDCILVLKVHGLATGYGSRAHLDPNRAHLGTDCLQQGRESDALGLFTIVK
jgi:hypothetical protein